MMPNSAPLRPAQVLPAMTIKSVMALLPVHPIEVSQSPTIRAPHQAARPQCHHLAPAMAIRHPTATLTANFRPPVAAVPQVKPLDVPHLPFQPVHAAAAPAFHMKLRPPRNPAGPRLLSLVGPTAPLPAHLAPALLPRSEVATTARPPPTRARNASTPVPLRISRAFRPSLRVGRSCQV